MFRKILSILVALFMFLPNAYSAEMVNVEYIHQYLNARWGIDLPRNPLTNPYAAANMKYLLTVVDIANEYLNGDKTTDYGNSEYATLAAADTVATNTAIDTLISVPTFTITTTPNTSSFSMIIGAAGNFTIDWGDGQSDVITDKPTGATTYSHTYSASGEYEIKLSGRATDYSDAKIDMDTGTGLVPTFTLSDMVGGSFVATNVAKISGSLGKIFPTMDDGTNPNFFGTFAMAPITEIPADLFEGIHGAPTVGMFSGTFAGTAITEIPAYLFGELNGNGAMAMFESTFAECTNLTTVGGPLFSGTLTPADGMFASTFYSTNITEIPADLFGELNGNGAIGMFSGTFFGCANLTTVGGPLFSGTLTPVERMFAEMFSGSGITSVPENIFGNLTGDGAPSMFDGTFAECANLTTVDGPLFSGALTPAEGMFNNTFSGCDQLQSIPENIFGNLTGDATPYMFYQTFAGCANLTTVGGPLFSGTLTPAEWMFGQMFSGSGITSIPENIFGNLTGDGAPYMFYGTFSGCANLTTVGGPLFSGTLTPAKWMFYQMFYSSGITSVPENMFGELTGDGAYQMFDQTFVDCKDLTTVGGPLFSGTLTPAEDMFGSMFSRSGITSVPENIFGELTGNGAPSMFGGTFSLCANLTTVEGPLFSGTLTPAESMFAEMFRNSGITSIPTNMFGELTGDGAPSMFERTFEDCKDLTTVGGPLFSGTLTPAGSMFEDMFSRSGITSVPENIFGNLTGDGAPNMFNSTFYQCRNLTTVGGPLFSGTITPAEQMFANTFWYTAITEIPADLFAGIQGAPASSMFNDTFYGCTQLQSIPENLFGNISGPAANSMFGGTFYSCTSLTGPSARINGQYLYEIWPDVSYMGTYRNATGLSDYDQIPGNWK